MKNAFDKLFNKIILQASTYDAKGGRYTRSYDKSDSNEKINVNDPDFDWNDPKNKFEICRRALNPQFMKKYFDKIPADPEYWKFFNQLVSAEKTISGSYGWYAQNKPDDLWLLVKDRLTKKSWHKLCKYKDFSTQFLKEAKDYVNWLDVVKRQREKRY